VAGGCNDSDDDDNDDGGGVGGGGRGRGGGRGGGGDDGGDGGGGFRCAGGDIIIIIIKLRDVPERNDSLRIADKTALNWINFPFSTPLFEVNDVLNPVLSYSWCAKRPSKCDMTTVTANEMEYVMTLNNEQGVDACCCRSSSSGSSSNIVEVVEVVVEVVVEKVEV